MQIRNFVSLLVISMVVLMVGISTVLRRTNTNEFRANKYKGAIGKGQHLTQ